MASAPRSTGGAKHRAENIRPETIWLFDLDNTLHDASHAAFGPTGQAMGEYIAEHVGLPAPEAHALGARYFSRYGATMIGLVRHHGVRAAHFLEETHRLPGLEERLRTSSHDRAMLMRLKGRKYILTNAPRAYAMRVLDTLDLTHCFDGIFTIEDMTMFGQHRPKPDARMFRRLCARLKAPPSRCVLVEDTLEHQKSARGVGMRTVWMQRYLGGRFLGSRRHLPDNAGRREPGSVRRCPKPAYVYAKIRSLRELPGPR